MKRLLTIAGWALLTAPLFAQVDVEHRRTLAVQTAFPVAKGEEQLGGFGYFWFNENQFPATNMALRVIFAGIFGDAELSYFLPAQPQTAIGIGGGGGFYIDSVTPYRQGERLARQQFYGDTATARVFINHELARIPVADLGELPVNVRGTYAVTGSFYREADRTEDFTLPDDFMTQTLLAELRFGGIEPGLAARRGAELYVAAEANYRSGFDAFGPDGALFPAHSEYQRLFGSLGGKLPLKQTLLVVRVAGGLGEQLDELSAYKLGGHLLGADAFSYPLHGYYTREIFADDFALVNAEFIVPLGDRRELAGHLYGDYAVADTFDVTTGRADESHSFIGVGAGLSFRGPWQVRTLITYGYGVNAVRNGDHGGHEIGLALEKSF